jgi:hypothetical protein
MAGTSLRRQRVASFYVETGDSISADKPDVDSRSIVTKNLPLSKTIADFTAALPLGGSIFSAGHRNGYRLRLSGRFEV